MTVGSLLGIQLRLSGSSARVTVHREGGVARVSLADTALGGPFSGGDRFEWVPASVASHRLPGSASLEALRIQQDPGEVSLFFRVPVATAIEVRREPSAVTLVLHEPPTPALSTVVASAGPQTPPRPEEARPAERAPALAPVAAAKTPEPAAAPPAASLLRTLFPAAPPPEAPSQVPPPEPPLAGTRDAEGPRAASADELHRKLFPFAPPETQEAPAVKAETEAGPPGPRTLSVGFLTLHPSLRMSYIKGEATIESAQPVSAGYVQVQPGLDLETTFWEGRLRLGYEPYIRGFSSYEVLEEPTHRGVARLDLPVGSRFTFKATDTFMSGVLETQEVDPGYEYFFGLSRFRRNTVGVNGSLEVAPRLSIEAGGVLSTVRFDQPLGFFPYDSRSALLGLGFELTPKLKATLGYVYDRVPPPDGRPLAEATAHSVQATVSGEITPLLASQLTLGYRDQTSPRAPESGRRFRGPTASGSLTRAFGTASWLTLSVSRATPVSNFESNAFYVSTYADASLVLPLPLALWLDSAVDHRWNDYRTDAFELGRPRDDEIFGWRVGLRRAFGPVTNFAIGYRRDRRRSNLDQFDNTTDRLILQLDFNVSAASGYR